jgi:hypothetical protein
MRLPSLATLLGALALTSCGSATERCVPAGVYFPTITRSANPGDCPADVDLLDSTSRSFDEEEICGTEKSAFEGAGNSGGYECAEDGTETMTVTSDGIADHVTIHSNCWGDGSVTCTAYYDVMYRTVSPN